MVESLDLKQLTTSLIDFTNSTQSFHALPLPKQRNFLWSLNTEYLPIMHAMIRQFIDAIQVEASPAIRSHIEHLDPDLSFPNDTSNEILNMNNDVLDGLLDLMDELRPSHVMKIQATSVQKKSTVSRRPPVSLPQQQPLPILPDMPLEGPGDDLYSANLIIHDGFWPCKDVDSDGESPSSSQSNTIEYTTSQLAPTSQTQRKRVSMDELVKSTDEEKLVALRHYSSEDLKQLLDQSDLCQMTEERVLFLVDLLVQDASQMPFSNIVVLLERLVLVRLVDLQESVSRELISLLATLADREPKGLVQAVLVPLARKTQVTSNAHLADVMKRVIKGMQLAVLKPVVEALFDDRFRQEWNENMVNITMALITTTSGEDAETVRLILNGLQMGLDAPQNRKQIKYATAIKQAVSRFGCHDNGAQLHAMAERIECFMQRSILASIAKFDQPQ